MASVFSDHDAYKEASELLAHKRHRTNQCVGKDCQRCTNGGIDYKVTTAKEKSKEKRKMHSQAKGEKQGEGKNIHKHKSLTKRWTFRVINCGSVN